MPCSALHCPACSCPLPSPKRWKMHSPKPTNKHLHRRSLPGCAASRTATQPTARRGASGNSARRAAGTWRRQRAAWRQCLRVGACCWRRSRHARWMMRKRSVRAGGGRLAARSGGIGRSCRSVGGTECVRTAAIELRLCPAAQRSWRGWDSCRPRSAPTQGCGSHQSARRPMLPSMMRRFSLRSPPSSRV